MRRQTLATRLRNWLNQLLGEPPAPERMAPRPRVDLPRPEPVTKRVGYLIIDPVVPGGRRLSQVMGWNDSDRLAAALIKDLREVSHGYANYEIAERMVDDEFPVKADGFQYTAEDYLQRWRARAPFHQPDAVDYQALIRKFDLVEKVNAGVLDEVWAICFPWGGFYESRMVGPGAFWCNAPPLERSANAQRKFVIMCYNYERGVGEMLESYGHRAESILQEVFKGVPEPQNLWQRYTLYDKITPGRAEVGNVHFAPNSQRDYEWGSMRPVPSRCRSWRAYPDLSGEPVMVDAREWGGGDIRAHHRWWFELMPHVGGETQAAGGRAISNNWWQYIVDPNLVQ